MKKTIIGFAMASVLFLGLAASTLQRGEVTTSRVVRQLLTNETKADIRAYLGVGTNAELYDLSLSTNLGFEGLSDAARQSITNAASKSASDATNAITVRGVARGASTYISTNGGIVEIGSRGDFASDENTLGYIRGIASRVINARRANFNDGTTGRNPGIGYGAFYLRDWNLARDGMIDEIPLSESFNMINTWSNKFFADGALPDFVYADKSSIFNGFSTNGGKLMPSLDVPSDFMHAIYLDYIQRGSADMFSNCWIVASNAINFVGWSNNAYTPFTGVYVTNGLVYTERATTLNKIAGGYWYGGFGFHDGIPKKGYDLWLSLLRFRALNEASELCAVAGSIATASNLQFQASLVKSNLKTYLWSSTNNFFFSATETNVIADPLGSAYAVWLGAVDEQTAITIASNAAACSPGGVLFPTKFCITNGAVMIPGFGNYWQWSPTALPGAGQNGTAWQGFAGIWNYAVGLYDPASASSNWVDFVNFTRASTNEPFLEFFGPQGAQVWGSWGYMQGAQSLQYFNRLYPRSKHPGVPPKSLAAGTVPVAASALTGTASINTTGNAAGATNIFGQPAFDGASVSNLNYFTLRQRAWDDWSLNCENIPKIKKQLAQQGSLKLLVFSDDAIIGSGEFHRAMLQNLSQTMVRGGSLGVGGTYCYLLGDGAGYVIHAGEGSTELFQTGWVGFSSGTENMTNITTSTGTGIPTTHLSVSCALLNGGGTYTVSTQTMVNGVYTTAKGTAFSFSADNGGSPVPFVTNFYLGGEFNIIASISSSGGTTNILQAVGQWTTNGGTYVYDIWDIGGMSWLTAMTNQFQSNHISMVATNYDAIIVADAGYPDLGAPYADAMWQAKGLTADLVYLGINPATNLTYAQNLQARLDYSRLGTNGRPYIDVGSVFWSALYSPSSNSVVHSLYADAAHVTVPGGDMTANFTAKKLGLTPPQLVTYRYQQRNTGTNYFRISPFNSHVMVAGTINNTAPVWVDGIWSDYGNRFIASYFLPTASRQFAADIPAALMFDKTTIVLKQYWFTTNAQIISPISKVFRMNSSPTSAASEIGSTSGSFAQTATSKVVFTTTTTNSFGYPGRDGDTYSAKLGWGDSGTITNGLWWLGADVWMY